jgi:hypothetical protein
MSGTTTWAVAGPVIALAGLGLVAAGLLRGRRVTRRPGPPDHPSGQDAACGGEE